MQEAAAQALSEDPSIFEYDSVYDEMAEKKREKSVKAHKENKVSSSYKHLNQTCILCAHIAAQVHSSSEEGS